MDYQDFKQKYPHLSWSDHEDYQKFIASRARKEDWNEQQRAESPHKAQQMKAFYETAIRNWRARMERCPNPIDKYLIEYAEEWLQESRT